MCAAVEMSVCLWASVKPAASLLIAKQVVHVLIITVKTQLVNLAHIVAHRSSAFPASAAFLALLVRQRLIFASYNMALHVQQVISVNPARAVVPRLAVCAYKWMPVFAIPTRNVPAKCAAVVGCVSLVQEKRVHWTMSVRQITAIKLFVCSL